MLSLHPSLLRQVIVNRSYADNFLSKACVLKKNVVSNLSGMLMQPDSSYADGYTYILQQ